MLNKYSPIFAIYSLHHKFAPFLFGASDNSISLLNLFAACEEGKWGDNCAQTCNCTTDQYISCNPATGCVCNPEYTGETCSDDVDECMSVANACPTNSNCTNTVGNYSCVCLSGYTSTTTMSGLAACDGTITGFISQLSFCFFGQ